ncbi:hypothetical protein [Paraburkholderia sp. MM5477-R1]|uniref:hypothetical protein n=1 Tax=Paraburkholderia sp. MM5477-R1 TaxID=2991062 RepID=UPI003D23BE4D
MIFDRSITVAQCGARADRKAGEGWVHSRTCEQKGYTRLPIRVRATSGIFFCSGCDKQLHKLTISDYDLAAECRGVRQQSVRTESRITSRPISATVVPVAAQHNLHLAKRI